MVTAVSNIRRERPFILNPPLPSSEPPPPYSPPRPNSSITANFPHKLYGEDDNKVLLMSHNQPPTPTSPNSKKFPEIFNGTKTLPCRLRDDVKKLVTNRKNNLVNNVLSKALVFEELCSANSNSDTKDSFYSYDRKHISSKGSGRKSSGNTLAHLPSRYQQLQSKQTSSAHSSNNQRSNYSYSVEQEERPCLPFAAEGHSYGNNNNFMSRGDTCMHKSSTPRSQKWQPKHSQNTANSPSAVLSPHSVAKSPSSLYRSSYHDAYRSEAISSRDSSWYHNSSGSTSASNGEFSLSNTLDDDGSRCRDTSNSSCDSSNMRKSLENLNIRRCRGRETRVVKVGRGRTLKMEKEAAESMTAVRACPAFVTTSSACPPPIRSYHSMDELSDGWDPPAPLPVTHSLDDLTEPLYMNLPYKRTASRESSPPPPPLPARSRRVRTLSLSPVGRSESVGDLRAELEKIKQVAQVLGCRVGGSGAIIPPALSPACPYVLSSNSNLHKNQRIRSAFKPVHTAASTTKNEHSSPPYSSDSCPRINSKKYNICDYESNINTNYDPSVNRSIYSRNGNSEKRKPQLPEVPSRAPVINDVSFVLSQHQDSGEGLPQTPDSASYESGYSSTDSRRSDPSIAIEEQRHDEDNKSGGMITASMAAAVNHKPKSRLCHRPFSSSSSKTCSVSDGFPACHKDGSFSDRRSTRLYHRDDDGLSSEDEAINSPDSSIMHNRLYGTLEQLRNENTSSSALHCSPRPCNHPQVPIENLCLHWWLQTD